MLRRLFCLLTFVTIAISQTEAQKFYPDDPVEREPSPRPVEKAVNRKLSDYYDLLLNQLSRPGDHQPRKGPPIPAQGVNTLGEPMEGAWWEKRHYYSRMSIEELQRGPDIGPPPSFKGKWTVVSAKNEGITPGFVIIDPEKRRYFVKFDPLTNPEMATAADSITSRLFYALGYHVPQNYIVYFTDDQLEIGPDVEISDKAGKRRQMTRRDLTEILLKVPRNAEGKYRGTASLTVEGKTIGPPRWYGTRSDDPNDIVPHEHRRDQRGLHVIDAWVNHDDSRAINNLDVLVKKDGVQYIKHYQLDFGSTLGSGTQMANSPRSGAYFFSWSESAKNLFSLGLRVPYWAFAHYPNYPSVGRFEWKVFDPERWVPEYPNTAFENRLPDDEFWAAKQVMAFTDDEIRAVVSTGGLSDKAAEKWLAECLIERRNKIGRAYFAKVLPLDRFTIDNGELKWVDLSRQHGFGGVANVDVQWHTFDNNTKAKTPIPGANSPRLPEIADGQYALAVLTDRANTSHTILVYLRGQSSLQRIVGLERTW